MRWLRLCLMLPVLWSCGSSDPSDIPAEFPEPEVLDWTPCGARAECSTLTVPVDYSDPRSATIQLRAKRLPAYADRVGTLLVLSGAGDSGADMAEELPQRVIPMMSEVVRRFDVVGLDLRGQGESVPALRCLATEDARFEFYQELATAPSEGARTQATKNFLGDCEEQLGLPLASFRVENRTRDLEHFRQSLNEPTWTLLGSAAGSWDGAAYAVSYPDQVRGAVMGASVPYPPDGVAREASLALSADAALSAFLSWCDATSECGFRPSSSSSRAAFDALVAQIAAEPLSSDAGLLDLEAFDTALGVALYFPENYPDIAAGLAAAQAGSPDLVLSALRSQLTNKAESVVLQTVVDNPVARGATLEDWQGETDALPLQSWVPAPSLALRLALAWERAPDAFEVRPTSAPPFLFLSNDLDPASPRDGTAALASALGNGSVVLDTRVAGHDAFRGACALERARDYVLEPTALAQIEDCPVPSPNETPVGSIAQALPWSPDDSRVGESALGNLVADAMRTAVGAQIALVNGGGIRAGLPALGVEPEDQSLRRTGSGYAPGPPFDVVVDDVRAMLPFGNRIHTMELTGLQVWEQLEHGVSTFDGVKGHGEFLQVSGVRVRFDPRAVAGERVASVELEDGTPIANDDSRTYNVAIADYVRYGGTGDPSLFEAPAVPGPTIDEAVAQYLVETSGDTGVDLEVGVEGRIAALTN